MLKILQKVHSSAAQDGTQWTCEIEALRQVEENKNDIVRLQKTDFTKKGAQRLAAFAFMRQFNKESQQALDWSIEIAKEKLEKSDGVDKAGVDILIVLLSDNNHDF